MTDEQKQRFEEFLRTTADHVADGRVRSLLLVIISEDGHKGAHFVAETIRDAREVSSLTRSVIRKGLYQ